MSIRASKLSKSGAKGRTIDTIVREHLAIIDDALMAKDRAWGRNVVTIPLPMTFNIPGLDPRREQLVIYSALVSDLEARGFEVGLELDQNYTNLHLAWLTDLSEEELKAMNAVIRRTSLRPDQVGSFVRKGRVAAPAAAGSATSAARLTENRTMAPRGGLVGPGSSPDDKAEPTVAEEMLLD